MKVLSSRQLKNAEAASQNLGVSLETLMQNAGRSVAKAVLCRSSSGKAAILCGNGNNGGDGFVCATALAQTHEVYIIMVQGNPRTQLSAAVFKQLPATVTVFFANADKQKAIDCLCTADVIIDAVFGFGFHGEIYGQALNLLSIANQATGLRVAIDLPSGASCDTGCISTATFRADLTITFHALKPALVSYPARAYAGETKVVQIGMPHTVLVGTETPFACIDDNLVSKIMHRNFHIQANKGDNGRLLMVCGSEGMAGACILAAKAALRSGVGLLDIALEERLYPIVSQAVPEAIFTLLPLCDSLRLAEVSKILADRLEKASACLFGCGCGDFRNQLAEIVFNRCRTPLVVDADGINALAASSTLQLPNVAPIILTPHPGEMARLTGKSVQEVQANRLNTVLLEAERRKSIVVLKGAGTIIAAPDGKARFNLTGNPGMAKGGSGDVLAGMLGALLAQGLPAFDAATACVYLHGKAGDWCAQQLSARAMLPSDLIKRLPAEYLCYERDTGAWG